MRLTRPGVRGLGLLVGMTLSLGVAAGSAPPAPARAGMQAQLLGNRSSKIYHKVTCAAGRRTSEKNRVELRDVDAAEAGGYKPCRICKPDEGAEAIGPVTVAQKTKGKAGGGSKTSRPKADATGTEPAPADASGAERLSFVRDVAPVLAGNCLGCHNAEQKKGELDLSTFRKLMAGSQAGPVIVPGKPEESILVEMVVSRKMPRGGNRRLADEAIARIERWVREGALLDRGVDADAALDQVAPSPEARRRAELGKLSDEERDQKLLDLARERWKQAGAGDEPRMTPGKHFALFGELPEDRAKAVLKALEDQRLRLGTLLGQELAGSLAGPEKVSVYVFHEVNPFAEFVRGVERREVEEGVHAAGRLDVEGPYLVAVDPLAGGEEPKAAPRRPARAKDRAEEPSGPDRSLTGLLVEQLGVAVARAAGNAPSWLTQGLGAYLASQVEPRSPYYNRLRLETVQQYQLGWPTKASEVLGDQAAPDALRALGFSLFEWMGSSFGDRLPPFVRGLAQEGGAKLDDVIKACFGQDVDRDQFLGVWGQWVALRYGSLMRRR